MGEVFFVTRKEAAEAAETLAQAFLEESSTDWFFPSEEGDKLAKLRALFGWAVDYRLATGLPLLGVRDRDGVYAGTATMRTPSSGPVPEIVEELWKGVGEQFGPAAVERMDLYDAAQAKAKLDIPYHYVVAIGVLPSRQGQGWGGALLRRAIEVARDDPESKGVGLDTSSPENEAYYRKFGFETYSRAELGPKVIRFMFCPVR